MTAITGPASLLPSISFMCRACGESRPDAFISCAKRKIVVDRGEPVEINLCYCNDRPLCFRKMAPLLDEAARPIIENMIAPRVHLLWQGLAICDPHKRWPEDFPDRTKWIGLTEIHSNASLFAEVTCAPCRERGAHFVTTRPDCGG